MIISASRRTDIPACYPEWFMNRIREGYFCSVNPFNPKQVSRISLRPEDVDIIVFWTKNPLPLLEYLPELDSSSYLYYFQFTLNDYPKWLEPGLPPVSERIQAFIELSESIGPGRVLWRYDPIILSTETPVDYHIERVDLLARKLGPYTKRLTISFLDFYPKIMGRVQQIEEDRGIKLWDIRDSDHQDELRRLCLAIGNIGLANNLDVVTCAEKLSLEQFGILPGSCIDAGLIRRLTGRDIRSVKDPGQRDQCLCAPSVDMGVYNTCKNGCIYCYANTGQKAIQQNLARHSVNGPSLIMG
ncbi:MAG: DUF1848 domain-containing protein [Bacillota bacterium]